MESRRETQHIDRGERWPALLYEEWRDTCQTLHMWAQIVGKVRMELSPFLNHWWHVTLYVTPRGLTTLAISYHGGSFDVTFDFLEHTLFMRTSEGTAKALPLTISGREQSRHGIARVNCLFHYTLNCFNRGRRQF